MKKSGIIFFILFLITSVIAQDKVKAELTDTEISEITSKLSMKLLMNEKQKSGVTALLNTYRTETSKLNSAETGYKNKEELISAMDSQITALFDSKQKMKYDVLKKDWWESIKSAENN